MVFGLLWRGNFSFYIAAICRMLYRMPRLRMILNVLHYISHYAPQHHPPEVQPVVEPEEEHVPPARYNF